MSQLTKGQKKLFVVLAIVVLYAVYDIASNWDTYVAYYSNKSRKVNLGKNTNDQVSKKVNIPENKSYQKTWNEDPFYIAGKRSYTKRSVSSSEVVLKLKAISYAGENSVVMINNSILKIGDIIEEYRIEKIEQNRVSLIKDGKVKILSLQ